jgi:hypothetical protein
MTQNTYPDGFPLTPLEAIDFSYTFSNEEKNEWRDWVKTATPEQQQELVDTLHSIWIENQKEVVPSGFNKTENIIQESVEIKNTESPVVDKVIETVPQSVNKVPNINENINENRSVPVSSQEIKPQLAEKPQEKTFVFNEKPTPNIPIKLKEDSVIASDNFPDRQRNQQRQNNNSNQLNTNNQGNRNNQPQNTQSSNPSNKTKQTMNFFDFAKVRESATRDELERLQKDFIIVRQKRYDLEQTYSTQLSNLINESDQKQQVLFDKVVQISLNFENVADYLQNMTEKLLQTNESNIVLETKVKSLEILLDEKIKNLSYDKDNTQHDIDRLFREMREMRESLRSEILDIKRTSSVSTVDSFGDEGVKLKLGILSNKLTALENNMQNNVSQSKSNKQQPQVNKNENKPSIVDKKNEQPPVKSDKPSDNILDISDIV